MIKENGYLAATEQPAQMLREHKSHCEACFDMRGCQAAHWLRQALDQAIDKWLTNLVDQPARGEGVQS